LRLVPQIRFVYHKDYNFNRALPLLKQVHGFVLNKPARIRRKLMELGAAKPAQFEVPAALREESLSAIHTKEVVAGWKDGKAVAAAGEFPPLAMLPTFISRRLLVKPQLQACAGTQAALMHAAKGDSVFNLSGGFHHARPDLSHGFCLMTDVAWAVHSLNERGLTPRILVLDLDLHQGDGNAAAFAGREDVFTASLHQEDTFPFPKLESDLDIGLDGGAVDDERYLETLDDLLSQITERFQPEVVIYVAGTDPYHEDAIGSFSLSEEGLVERDRRVARFVRKERSGLVVLPAGGYSSASPELSASGYAAMAEELRARA
jgi:acetoin utilization deacetylase AcuC-like enzyme